jgi:hypothetical protein
MLSFLETVFKNMTQIKIDKFVKKRIHKVLGVKF